jgi:cytochrome c oxidase subunit I
MSETMRIEPAVEKGFFDGILGRQVEPSGLIGWLTTVDHKRIGILYAVTALLWFVVGGIEALAIRVQLFSPGLRVVTPDTYNQLFTMHATTMIFLVVMPLAAGFFNFMIPLMIGARDVAFPRMNAFSYWLYLFGSILINLSWLIGHAPNQGWFGYAPLTEKQFNGGYGVDFWILGLQVLGVASVIASLNFITTIINMRARGMTFMRMPVFVWMTFVTNFLVVLAFPVITIALAELMFDRSFGTNFFQVSKGGLPILWQHLFWVFGHPEVYILILPPMGIVSEVLPVFSRRPLYGYPLVVGSGAAIGFMGFTVWAHHMFTTGIGNIAVAAFSLTTMSIAVPTGVKIINWVGTLYGGQLRMKTPMLFALGFIYQFMMGGFSGLMHASAPHDSQQQDTYFIVAHFHYVLIGGAIFGLFSGIYYWYPKMVGRMLNEKRGHLVFWLLFGGFNLTFFPMHWLGLNGMPRRIYSYDGSMGWNTINATCTVGAFFMAVAVLVSLIDIFYLSAKFGEVAPADPWDGRTLEWSIPSPPPCYNFKDEPNVLGLDTVWLTKHPELVEHDEHAGDHGAVEHHHDDHGHGIHMPGGSWFPMIAAGGLVIGAFGLIMMAGADYTAQYQIDTNVVKLGGEITKATVSNSIFWHWVKWAIGGAGIMVWGIFMWSLEPIGGYYIHFEENSNEH